MLREREARRRDLGLDLGPDKAGDPVVFGCGGDPGGIIGTQLKEQRFRGN